MSKKDEIRHEAQEAQDLAKKIKNLKVSKDPRIPCTFCGLVSVKSQQSRHRKKDYNCRVIRAKQEVKKAQEALHQKQVVLFELLQLPVKS